MTTPPGRRWWSPWAAGMPAPTSLGKRYLDWDLPDPKGLGVEGTRPVRDEIRRRIE